MCPWSGECGLGNVGEVLDVTMRLFLLLVRQKLPLLGRLSSFGPVRDGADCPRVWFLIRTRLVGSPGCCHANWLTPLCMLLDRGRSCFPVRELARLLRRGRPSSWLSCLCSFTFPAEGERSGLLSFLKSRGAGAANSFASFSSFFALLCSSRSGFDNFLFCCSSDFFMSR